MNTSNVVNDTKENLAKASECITNESKEIKKHAQEYTAELEKFIKDSPLKSALIASAVGLIIGKLFL